MKSELGDAATEDLKRAFKGAVWRRGDAGFVRHSQLFNATIRSPAQLLVRPLDVDDVSEAVQFCVKHNLSLSVKSGGYGTHGWAVEGDVVVDMRLVAQITIERPMEHSEVDWVSMRESPHVAVKDPDSLKGKGRMPSATAFPTSYPTAGVGPQPIHAPFGESPYRRSADEAFENVVVVPPDAMDADDRSDPDSDRPTRRLRISSPASAHASHASNTPPTTNSPHTPADGFEPKPSNQPKPFSFDDPPNKSLASTREDVEHDEGMLPPTADRPGAGVDMRGYVGRDVGGWDTVWTGRSEGAAAESVGATYAIAMGDSAGTAPPVLPPRSTAPISARPFDFGEASPAIQVNALANPHGNPSLGARPFQLARSNSATNSDHSTPNPEPEPAAPTVTHVAFEPTAPVPYTYVTFGAGASQKDVDAFCAAHPLAAVTAGNLAQDGVDGVDGHNGVDGADGHDGVDGVDGHDRIDGTDGIDGRSDGIDGKPAKKPTIVADSSRPNLYQTPQGTGFGPGSGSFFAPGVGLGAGGAHGFGSVGFGQPSTFGSPGSTFFGQPPNPIFGNALTTPTIPYYVPFAAHPVGSTVMLLGGFGFLSRLRGLSMDCLVEAEVVLADGRVVWVSKGGVRDRDGNEVEIEDEPELDDVAKEFIEAEKERARRAKEKEKADDESDGDLPVLDEKPRVDGEAPEEGPVKKGLWWALRGAGSAFGIVVRYKARAFPVPVVFAGNLIYNFNKSTAASLIKHFRDCIKAAPRELYANCILTSGPKGRGALVVIQICYAGSRADGLPFLQAISSWDVEPCLLNEVQEKEFVWQQDSIAKVLKGGSGRKWFIRSDLISSLTDEIIHRTVMKFSDTPDGCTWLFELSGGALMDTTDSCLPKKAREAAFTIVALHQWRLELDDPACVLTAEGWIKDTLMTQSTGGPFPCFLERRERRERILGVYGPENWARLCALKKKYDPTGLFKHNFWPLDEGGRPVLDPRKMRSGADMTGGHVMDETLDERGVPI